MFDTNRTIKLSIRDQLRMSSVNRWQIMKVDRGQNVAEHTCNVMLISVEILCRYNALTGSGLEVMPTMIRQALYHDLPEVMTGDIPSPMKRALSPAAMLQVTEIEECFVPRSPAAKGSFVYKIVKCADYIDAIHFLTNNANDAHSASALNNLRVRLAHECSKCDNPELQEAISGVLQDALNGKQTFMEDLV